MSEVEPNSSKSRHSTRASREHSRNHDGVKVKDKKEKRRKSRSSNSGRSEIKNVENVASTIVTDFPIKFDAEEAGPSHGNLQSLLFLI